MNRIVDHSTLMEKQRNDERYLIESRLAKFVDCYVLSSDHGRSTHSSSKDRIIFVLASLFVNSSREISYFSEITRMMMVSFKLINDWHHVSSLDGRIRDHHLTAWQLQWERFVVIDGIFQKIINSFEREWISLMI